MEGDPKFQKVPTDEEYRDLKSRLFDGSLSFDQVYDELLKFDQSIPTRDAADENIKFLYDPELEQYVQGHPEMEVMYKNILTLTEFHVAQRLAWDGSEGAVEHFRKALESAEPGTDWAAYVEGSLLYGEGGRFRKTLSLAQPKEGTGRFCAISMKACDHAGPPIIGRTTVGEVKSSL